MGHPLLGNVALYERETPLHSIYLGETYGDLFVSLSSQLSGCSRDCEIESLKKYVET